LPLVLARSRLAFEGNFFKTFSYPPDLRLFIIRHIKLMVIRHLQASSFSGYGKYFKPA
jgi:hypothetical protein